MRTWRTWRETPTPPRAAVLLPARPRPRQNGRPAPRRNQQPRAERVDRVLPARRRGAGEKQPGRERGTHDQHPGHVMTEVRGPGVPELRLLSAKLKTADPKLKRELRRALKDQAAPVVRKVQESALTMPAFHDLDESL